MATPATVPGATPAAGFGAGVVDGTLEDATARSADSSGDASRLGLDSDALTVFVGTWNVGNVAPRMDACREWLARARGHHLVAVAAQEASYPHSRANLSPKAVSAEMSDAAYHVERLGWLRSSKMARVSGAIAGAVAGGVATGPLAPFGAVVGAAAGYYSSAKVAEEMKVRNHWFDVVKAAVGPGYRVVQTAVLLQMRLIVLAVDPVADLIREVRVGYQATGVFNAIGNKGGLMVRAEFRGGDAVAFVAAHLAAHEGAKHVAARNESLAKILQGCWEGSMVREIGQGGAANARANDDAAEKKKKKIASEKKDDENANKTNPNAKADPNSTGLEPEGARGAMGLVTAMSADAASLATKALEAVAGSTPRAGAAGSNPFASGGAHSGAHGGAQVSAHPPPPLELLACTTHVFVFGDLNYRVDPGAVTGTGWGTAWKKSNDAPSGSIAAAVAGLANKKAKRRDADAAFAAREAAAREAAATDAASVAAVGAEAAADVERRRGERAEGNHRGGGGGGGGDDDDEDPNVSSSPAASPNVSSSALNPAASVASSDASPRDDSESATPRGTVSGSDAARWVEGWHAVVSAAERREWSRLRVGDQLDRERRLGRVLHGFEEGALDFPPTFKIERVAHPGGDAKKKTPTVADASAADGGEGLASSSSSAPRYSRKRVPSWCDRVLLKSLPGWDVGAATTPRSRVVAYGACHGVSTSDHAPVYASCEVTIRGAKRDANANANANADRLARDDSSSVSHASSVSDPSSVSHSSHPRTFAEIRVRSFRVVLEDADVGGPTRRDESAAATNSNSPRGTNAAAAHTHTPAPRDFLDEGYHVPGTPMYRAASPARRETMMDKLLAARDSDEREANGGGNGNNHPANGSGNGSASAPQALDSLAEALRRLSSGAGAAAAHFAVPGDASDAPPGAVADAVAERDAPPPGEGKEKDDGGVNGGRVDGGVHGGVDGGGAGGDDETPRAREKYPVVEISWLPSALPSLEIGARDLLGDDRERAGAGSGSGDDDANVHSVAARLERAKMNHDSRLGVRSDADSDTSSADASRLASSLASRNVVATVTVDRDAVGTAVIPLAEAAAKAAAEAVEAAAKAAAASAPSAASAPAASAPIAASASASFSAPVTRFGRLCGVAEGELEVIVRGVGDE